MVMKMGSVFIVILTYRDDAGRSWERVISPQATGSGHTLLRQTQRTKADAHSTPKDLVQKQEKS